MESYFEIDHSVSKLLSVELFNNTTNLQSNITMKWPTGNSNIHVAQKTRNIHILCIQGVPEKVTEFQNEITSEIFDVENRFGYFRKAETCSGLAG